MAALGLAIYSNNKLNKEIDQTKEANTLLKKNNRLYQEKDLLIEGLGKYKKLPTKDDLLKYKEYLDNRLIEQDKKQK